MVGAGGWVWGLEVEEKRREERGHMQALMQSMADCITGEPGLSGGGWGLGWQQGSGENEEAGSLPYLT